MNVTKDVIADLLPLYEAGEASADTRALVEAYLEEHPGTLGIDSVDAMLKAKPAASLPERDRRAALERTRSLIKRRTLFFAAALGCNLMTFSFAFSSSHGVTWLMWRDAPGMGAVLMVLSAGFWIAYFRVLNQLRVSGM